MTTRHLQTPPGDNNNNGTVQIVTFSCGAATMALSRHRSRFFLIYANGNNPLDPGKRIHSSLNVVSWHSNHHSKKGPKVASFWLNCNRGNGDPQDPTNDALHQLLNAIPPLVRRTGGKRKETAADDNTSTIICEEFEVLIPEEALIRQCYYCLSWEDDEHRHSQIKDDKHWCSKCRKKGRLLSTLTPKEKTGTKDGDPHAAKESIYS